MAARLFFAVVLGLLQLSSGDTTFNETNATDSDATISTTTTTTTTTMVEDSESTTTTTVEDSETTTTTTTMVEDSESTTTTTVEDSETTTTTMVENSESTTTTMVENSEITTTTMVNEKSDNVTEFLEVVEDTTTTTTMVENSETTTTTAVLAYHKVIGQMTLDVDDPVAFVDDPDGKAKAAIAKSLAEQLQGVEEDMIIVTLELKDARRLAAVRSLAAQQVLVTYVITMSASDTSAAATLGEDVSEAIKSITPADMKTSLTAAFTTAGLSAQLGEVVIEEPFSQAVGKEDETVTLPTQTSPSPSPTPSPSSPSLSPSPSSSSSPGKDDEDGSVRPGLTCGMVFGLLALLRTTEA